MTQPDDIVMWRDKRVDEMTLDELREAFQQLGRLYRAAQESHSHTLGMWTACTEARRKRGL